MVIYITAALLFALIILWMATSKKQKREVNVHNGSHRLQIVEGFTDTIQVSNPFFVQTAPMSVTI